MVVNQSHLHNSDQPANMKPSLDQSEETGFQSQQLHSQQSHQFQQQLIRSQGQQKQQNQRLPYEQSQSQLISDLGTRIKSEPNETFQSSQPINRFQHNVLEQQQHQQKQPHFGVDTRNNVNPSIGGQLDGQWHSRSQEPSHKLVNMSNELNIQEGSHQGIPRGHGQSQSQRSNNLSSEPSMAPKRSVDPPSANLDRQLQYKNQQRWILFLKHARNCGYPPETCPEIHCISVQKLLKHMRSCKGVAQCQFPRCYQTKALLDHNAHCRDQSCPVCVPVKLFMQQKGTRLTNASCDYTMRMSPSVETSEDLHPSMKRMKIEPPSQPPVSESEKPIISVPITNTSEVLQHRDACQPLKYEVTGVKLEVPTSSMLVTPKITEVARKDYVQDRIRSHDGVAVVSNEPTSFPKQEFFKNEKDVGTPKQEDVTLVAETSKSGKPKIKGVSMTELFTPEQVREHITGLRQWVGQVRNFNIALFCMRSFL